MPAVALVFHGATNYPATKNLRNALCGFGNGLPNANHGGVVFDKIYLLLSSEGGSIEEALALYNLIEALPAEVVALNMGQIASAGILPFLGACERWACDHSYFHFHNLSWTYNPAQTVHRMQMADHQYHRQKSANYTEPFSRRTRRSRMRISRSLSSSINRWCGMLALPRRKGSSKKSVVPICPKELPSSTLITRR